MDVDLRSGDSLEVLQTLPENAVDAVVTDPPYGLSNQPNMDEVLTKWLSGQDYEHRGSGFMGKSWDSFVPGPSLWREVYRVLKPGGHALVFAGSRTDDLMGIALRLAGFEIRDKVMWLYGSGFPKSSNVSKQIDKHGGVDIGWFGPWLREERKRRGITQRELARNFPSKTGGLTGCVANWELGFNIPTADQFNTLCEVLDLPFGRIEELEREVLETRTDSGNRQVAILGTESKEYDVTASRSPLAQQWDGWGSALKPAFEPVIVARKPFKGPLFRNVLEHGTGALNIDGCRVAGTGNKTFDREAGNRSRENYRTGTTVGAAKSTSTGRWPANIILSHHPDCVETVAAWECVEGCPIAMLDAQSGVSKSTVRQPNGKPIYGGNALRSTITADTTVRGVSDTGGASRFFYTAKASKKERNAGLDELPEVAAGAMKGNHDGSLTGGKIVTNRNHHPTVKPLALMRYLVRLVTPPGGTVLDPFMGSGSTGCATVQEGFNFIGIDLDPEYVEISRLRINHWAPDTDDNDMEEAA